MTTNTDRTPTTAAAFFRVEGVITPKTSLRAAAALALGTRGDSAVAHGALPKAKRSRAYALGVIAFSRVERGHEAVANGVGWRNVCLSHTWHFFTWT